MADRGRDRGGARSRRPAARVSAVRGFSSDNAAGIHPAALAALAAANEGHVPSYGADPLTEAVTARLSGGLRRGDAFVSRLQRDRGQRACALRAACRPWEAAICVRDAHIDSDETGAPEAAGSQAAHRRRARTACSPPS